MLLIQVADVKKKIAFIVKHFLFYKELFKQFLSKLRSNYYCLIYYWPYQLTNHSENCSCNALLFFITKGVTVTAGLISYPIDTIRRRMMMTSGQAVKYKGAIDCTTQIMKNEGFMSMMKGKRLFYS